jgi:Transglutaminase-like superfamily
MDSSAGAAQFVAQSALTDPGPWASSLDQLSRDLTDLREVPQRLTLHFRQAEAVGVDAAGRRREARMRQVSRMLERIIELDPRPLAETRSPATRLIGHCRTSAVLLTALLRQKGLAARPRAGFSAYWKQSMRTGHWVTEYWSLERDCWLIADSDLNEDSVRFGDLDFDLCEIPRDKFVLAGDAWLALRSGEVEPLLYGEDSYCFGLEYARAQLLRDVACLTGSEVGPWDRWGVAAVPFPLLDEPALALVDELARCSVVPHPRRVLTGLLADSSGLAVPFEIAGDGPGADVYMLDVPDLWRR